MLNDPEILLFDEPTLGVDVQSTHKIWEYIRSLKNHNKTIIVTTNVMAEADALCDELIIIDRGQKVCEGSPDKLKAELKTGTIHLTPAKGSNVSDELLRENIGEFSYDENMNIIIKAPNGERDLADILTRLNGVIALDNISMKKPTDITAPLMVIGLTYICFTVAVTLLIESFSGATMLTVIAAVLIWFLSGATFLIKNTTGVLRTIALAIPNSYGLSEIRGAVFSVDPSVGSYIFMIHQTAYLHPDHGWPVPTSLRRLYMWAGSSACRIAVPTRTAWAPAIAALFTSAGVDRELSLTIKQPGGI